MASYNVMTLLVNNRSKNSSALQTILTDSGCIINTRLGLHEAGNVCSEEGLIILQLTGSDDDIQKLEKNLNKIDGITAKNSKLSSR
jgi:hypothetical protein